MIRFEDDGGLQKNLVPPQALWAIAALLATVVLLAFIGRNTGIGVTGFDAADREGVVPVAERLISFGAEDLAGGGDVPVKDWETGEVLVVLEPGQGGFLRGAIRPLSRERRIRNADPAEPYRLTRWSDGRLTLHDPISDLRLDLAAYGSTNAASFATLLPRGESPVDPASSGSSSPDAKD
ncbi:MAG: phosphonoacetaldehyde hydrolase [Gemmatimonadales bacterium]|nr:MAG: phosphonoacetaldehyde hydrolase [Gemmatimonadales bacterium]